MMLRDWWKGLFKIVSRFHITILFNWKVWIYFVSVYKSIFQNLFSWNNFWKWIINRNYHVAKVVEIHIKKRVSVENFWTPNLELPGSQLNLNKKPIRFSPLILLSPCIFSVHSAVSLYIIQSNFLEYFALCHSHEYNRIGYWYEVLIHFMTSFRNFFRWVWKKIITIYLHW